MNIEELKKLEKELKEKISNREAVMVSYSDKMPKEKFEELAKWKMELEKLQNEELLEEQPEIIEENTEIVDSNIKKEEEIEISDLSNKLEDELEKELEAEKEELEAETDTDNTASQNKLTITLNKKTGEVTFDDGELKRTFIMDSRMYSNEKLKTFRKKVSDSLELKDEEKKYIKNIDPTIYKAYYLYDRIKNNPKNSLLRDEYAKTVIKNSKAIENDEEIEKNDKLADTKIDIGWHPRQKNMSHNSKEKFGLRNIIANFRANRILKKHGMNGKFFGSKMNLATISDNRKKIGGLTAFLLAGGTSTYLALSSGDNTKESQNTRVESQQDKEKQNINRENSQQNSFDENIKVDNIHENNSNIDTEKESIKEGSKIQFGDEVSVDKYSLIYEDSTSDISNGAISTNERLGVNKIACQIGDKLYTSKDYSFDEIYKMAKKAGVDVKYHVDKIKIKSGKVYVKANDKYVCNEDGILKDEDGKVFDEDIEYSSVAGWMNQNDVQKNIDKNNDYER